MENQLIYLEGNTIKVRRLSVEVFFLLFHGKLLNRQPWAAKSSYSSAENFSLNSGSIHFSTNVLQISTLEKPPLVVPSQFIFHIHSVLGQSARTAYSKDFGIWTTVL